MQSPAKLTMTINHHRSFLCVESRFKRVHVCVCLCVCTHHVHIDIDTHTHMIAEEGSVEQKNETNKGGGRNESGW